MTQAAAKSPPPPPEYLEWLSPYPDTVRQLALAARAEAVRRAPDATEIIADGVKAVAMGLSFTHTHVKGFLYIAAAKDHINVGFTYGASFDDPEHRLLGEGNQSRHMKVFSPADLEEPYLWQMFDQAQARAFRPEAPLPRKIVLMPYDGAKAKKRPNG
jgi:hypothetical protein